MILTDREIKLSITKKQLGLDPLPNEEAFSSTAVDLTLDPKALVFKQEVQQGLNIDPGVESYRYHSIINLLTETISTDPTYSLEPHKLLLAWTK